MSRDKIGNESGGNCCRRKCIALEFWRIKNPNVRARD